MSYTNLTYDERECIEYFISEQMNQIDIAKILGRHPSTIGREIRKNRHAWHGYQASLAQSKAKKRKCGQQSRPVTSNPHIIQMVLNGFKKGWSPDVISGRAKLEKSPLKISVESIYRMVFHDFQRGGTLWMFLPSKRKRRKHQLRRPTLRGHIKGRKLISERPETIEKRNRYGHWEGDSILGPRHRGAIFTSIERKSRYMVAWNAMKKEAKKMAFSTKQAFKSIPANLRKTLTLDNGLEFYNHENIAKNTGCDIYFARPGCPYERGSIENGNRYLRKTYPKGSDLKRVSHKELQKVIERINNTPRKILNYLTPFEVLFNEKKIALQI